MKSAMIVCKRLRLAGKSAKVAIVAIMRNLIEIANAVIKAERKWVKKLLDQDGNYGRTTMSAPNMAIGGITPVRDN